MEQHPIPQQISSYQFRLVGDMTLKQFFQLAGGFLVALIFYSAPLVGIIKWPFVITSAVLGVALAFLPLEERPLERWIFAFFRAIYAPTIYYWKKTDVLPKYFQDEPASQPAVPSTQQEAALKEYLSATTQKAGPLAKLEGAEQGFLTSLGTLFAGVVSQVGSMGQMTTTPVLPASVEASGEVKKEIRVPETIPIKIVPAGPPHLVVEEKPRGFVPGAPQITTHQVAPTIAGDEIISTKQAMFSIDAAPPNPPTTPNVIVGQVVDENRKIIEGAIMEIKDVMGRPIRALRSSRVGHFITVTPLENGRYDVVTEKDGFDFTPISFEAIGEIIPPILISGKKVESGASTPLRDAHLESGVNTTKPV